MRSPARRRWPPGSRRSARRQRACGSPGRPRLRDRRHADRARRDQRGPRRRPRARDRRAGRPDHRGPGRLQRPGRPASPRSTARSRARGGAGREGPELRERKALLAARLREAYRTDRTSLIETVLSADRSPTCCEDVGSYLDSASRTGPSPSRSPPTRRRSRRSMPRSSRRGPRPRTCATRRSPRSGSSTPGWPS